MTLADLPQFTSDVFGIISTTADGGAQTHSNSNPVYIIFPFLQNDTLGEFQIRYATAPVGTGGIPTMDIYATDSLGRKTGSILTTLTGTPSTNAFAPITGTPLNGLQGEVYIGEFYNADPSPATNYFIRQGSGIESPYVLPFANGTQSITWDGTQAMYPVFGAFGALSGPRRLSNGQDSTMIYNDGSRLTLRGNRYIVRNKWTLTHISALFANAQGSPNYDLRFDVYHNGAVVASSYAARALASSTFPMTAPFEFQPGIAYEVVIRADGSSAGDSSNNYRLTGGIFQLNPPTFGPIIGGVSSTALTPSFGSTNPVNIVLRGYPSGGSSFRNPGYRQSGRM